MDSKPVSLCVGTQRHRIQPVARLLCLGTHSYSIRQVLNRKGGLIIGEGDTGKSTYAQMLFEAAAKCGGRAPILVKLRTRPSDLSLPDVPKGETQTIIWDGLDEFPECARDIVDKTIDLDPERYHIWVTSRSGNAASVVAASPLLEDVYHLKPFCIPDMHALATSVNLDSEAFLDAVDAKCFWPFMMKPGGAVILMQLFANGQLNTGSRIDLMETVMLDFARETRDGDAECNPKLAYPLHQIIEATCWIAACLVLTGKSAIWTGAKSACPADDIFIEDIPSHGFDPAIFRAALGLRLFEPLTGERYRLAYSDMPAYLAGRWLAKNFPVDRIEELRTRLVLTRDENLQMQALVWAATFDMAFGKPFILHHPESFLDHHKLIAEVGFPAFVKAILETGCSETAQYDKLAGFKEFAKYLERLRDAHQEYDRVFDLSRFLLEHCQRDPDDTDPYSNIPDGLFGAAVAESPVDIPTEREVAARLSESIDSREVGELISCERARGFPYLALRSFLDDAVFKLQAEDEKLLRPSIVGCALVHDCARYLDHVTRRLPPLPAGTGDFRFPDNEPGVVYKPIIDESDEYDLDDDALDVPMDNPIDATSLSVCRALHCAHDLSEDVFADVPTFLACDVVLQIQIALAKCTAPWAEDINAIFEEIEQTILETPSHALNAPGERPARFTPVDLEALCAPPPTPPPLTREDMETILRKQVTEIKSHITAEANREPNAPATQSNQPERTTKIAPPDFSDLSSCKEFCHGLYTEIRGKMKDKVHSEIQAVQYILHGAKPGDLYYDDCAVARKIQKERNWERTTFATYCKQKVAPKRRTIKRAAKKHATQKKVRRDLRGL